MGVVVRISMWSVLIRVRRVRRGSDTTASPGNDTIQTQTQTVQVPSANVQQGHSSGSKGPSSKGRPSRADSLGTLGMMTAGLPTGIADPTTKRQGKSKALPKGGSTAGSAKAADHDAAGEHIAFSNMQPFAR